MIFSLILLFLSLILIQISKTIKKNVKDIKKRHKIQTGKITYSDLNKPAKPFFSRRYKIAGKPDYIIKKNNTYIPVELKNSRQNQPQKNHIYQLAAYCQLLEENYGDFVPYGVLVYNNTHQYKIPFDPKIRFDLETTLKKMRGLLNNKKVKRNHNEPNKCINCSMKNYCYDKLI